MAVAVSHCKRFSSLFSRYYGPPIRWGDQQREYSQYSPSFREPVIQLEEINKFIKEVPAEEVEFMKIKAATSHETCSVFYDPTVGKFINYVMRKGMKEVAREEVEKAFTTVKHIQLRKYNEEKDEEKKKQIILSPFEIFHKAIANATPSLKVTKIKKSGTWYKIPVGITPREAKIFAMKWFVEVSKDKEQGVPFYSTLANELVLASEGQGKAVGKKLELHKLCEANKSYAHYKWT
ncbi:hypothetical protein RUM43_003154 [Polyplax serrata]|uniref:Small ribosomal subunit protein uS7 domain-containing protein n=1 Tax=Polyplax serrata TaxID=468196 RepID=A0AAN8PNU3_POLSC